MIRDRSPVLGPLQKVVHLGLTASVPGVPLVSAIVERFAQQRHPGLYIAAAMAALPVEALEIRFHVFRVIHAYLGHPDEFHAQRSPLIHFRGGRPGIVGRVIRPRVLEHSAVPGDERCRRSSGVLVLILLSLVAAVL